jgi:hypothetical protein
MTGSSRPPLESEIKADIMAYLRALPGCYPRIVQIGQIPGRKNISKGLSDIVLCYRGRTWWIEVKRKGERPSPEQSEFIELWNRAAGSEQAFVAYSLEDVMRRIPPIQQSLTF